MTYICRAVVLTLFFKSRNGPLAIFSMAHGPLKKSTQINAKQHVGFLFYQKYFSSSCWFFWKVLRGPEKIVSRNPKGPPTPVWEPLL